MTGAAGPPYLIQLGEFQHDPIRHPIQALLVHLDALYKLSVESSRTLASLVETSRNPFSDDDLRRLADIAFHQLDERFASRMVEFNKAAIVIAVVAALAAAAVGFGAGWFGRGAPPVVQCVEQNGGGFASNGTSHQRRPRHRRPRRSRRADGQLIKSLQTASCSLPCPTSSPFSATTRGACSGSDRSATANSAAKEHWRLSAAAELRRCVLAAAENATIGAFA
ncbi:MAG: hypothetical protein ABSD61_05245 [Terracidiphilus sp.]|jgi:hypothetical protein